MSVSVWAPRPELVRLVHGEQVVAMQRDGDGWWHADTAIEPGDRYGFLLGDDPTPRPDPRSRFQPDGVHGLSQAFDPAGFTWADAGWRGRELPGSVIYELHVGTFTPEGTLDSAIERLDHLAALGIDLVEVLPVNAFGGTHNWGYDGVLWYAVDDSYGGPVAYQRFVDACHAHGLGVIQDVVYNHLGPSGNYLPRFAPYLRDGQANTWGDSVDLDQAAVRSFISDNVAMWLGDYHVDGLRLDAIHALVDTSPVHILAELSDRAAAIADHDGRPRTLIAESDLNDPIVVTPPELGGYGADAQWSDDFHHALHVALTGETTGYYADFVHLEALAKTIRSGFFHDGTYSSFRGRAHGRPLDLATTPTWRLVVSAQNHDQIGNRAAGDRLAATLDHQRLAVGAVLLLTTPFTPMLFMGEEWAARTPWQFFTAHTEAELAAATAQGRLDEFARMGWDPAEVPDPQDPDTFARSKLDWTELDQEPNRAMFELYRRLIDLRRSVPAIGDPDFRSIEVDVDDRARWIAIRRPGLAVLANLGSQSVTFPDDGTPLLTTGAVIVNPAAIELTPWSAAVMS